MMKGNAKARNNKGYYGTAEIAEACGVTNQAVSNWVARGQIPKPAFRLRMGPVWSIESPRFKVWLRANRKRRSAA
jgi:transcriptional regulator with XRE-family HTH domain